MFNMDKFAFFFHYSFFPKAEEAVSKLFPAELQDAGADETAVISRKPNLRIIIDKALLADH